MERRGAVRMKAGCDREVTATVRDYTCLRMLRWLWLCGGSGGTAIFIISRKEMIETVAQAGNESVNGKVLA